MRRILLAAPHPVLGIPLAIAGIAIGVFLEHGNHLAGTWALAAGIGLLAVYALRLFVRQQ